MIVASAALLAALAYTYAGYPILIALLARLRPRAIDADPEWTPTISVLIAVYNGADFIEEKLRSLRQLDYPSEKVELLFYDDGSSDDSAHILERLCDESRGERVILGGKRRGKPSALSALASQATGDVLLLTDIRQPLEPQSARALASALADPDVGCAGGLLSLTGDSGAGAYWKYERWIRGSESRFRSVVGVSGSIYAIRRDDFPSIPEDTILDDLYVPMRVRLGGRRIVLVREAVALDHAAADGREFGRKARTLAGNYQLLARMPALLSPFHNPSWFETVSHKFMRLLCPWFLVALLAVTAVAAPNSVPLAVLLGLQLAAYFAAVLGPLAGPIGKLARTFVVLNAAAVVGLWRFAAGGQRVTW